MNILIVGDQERAKELRQALPEDDIKVEHFVRFGGSYLSKYDVIFDLNFDDNWESLKYFAPLEKTPIFVGAVKRQVAQAIFEYPHRLKCRLVGMNTLPGFINRPKMEFSLYRSRDEENIVKPIAQQFGWQWLIVEDRVGMVTPRIVFMIINGACYTLMEGTASVEDIDKAMKLGTNYPYGPFEWADRIGIRQAYETLRAIYDDTGDERYKVCPLLKAKYLKGQSFYPPPGKAESGRQQPEKALAHNS